MLITPGSQTAGHRKGLNMQAQSCPLLHKTHLSHLREKATTTNDAIRLARQTKQTPTRLLHRSIASLLNNNKEFVFQIDSSVCVWRTIEKEFSVKCVLFIFCVCQVWAHWPVCYVQCTWVAHWPPLQSPSPSSAPLGRPVALEHLVNVSLNHHAIVLF